MKRQVYQGDYVQPMQYLNGVHMNPFELPTYNYGYSQNSAVLQYFDHIQLPEYPNEIFDAKQRVLQYIMNSPMNFDHIIESVNNIGGLSPMDQTVAFLLRTQQEMPIDCSVKADISALILYNMMKSYLAMVPILGNTHPGNINMYIPGQAQTQYREIIRLLLSKLKCCQNKLMTIMNGQQYQQPVTEIKYVQSPPEIQVRYMEKPTPPPKIITEIKYIEKPCPTLPPATEPPPTPVPYLQYWQAVPPAQNGFEKMKYDKIKEFLGRTDLEEMLGPIEFTTGIGEQEKINVILEKAVNLDLEKATIDAIKYYLNSAKSVAALNLYTQKEIHKQFQLTKIFTDVFDFESLSLEARIAFDSFFNFLMGVQGEQMTAFTTWTDVHTKGTFMQALFDYFLTQDFTPIEIKESIGILRPLIILDGPGATPP